MWARLAKYVSIAWLGIIFFGNDLVCEKAPGVVVTDSQIHTLKKVHHKKVPGIVKLHAKPVHKKNIGVIRIDHTKAPHNHVSNPLTVNEVEVFHSEEKIPQLDLPKKILDTKSDNKNESIFQALTSVAPEISPPHAPLTVSFVEKALAHTQISYEKLQKNVSTWPAIPCLNIVLRNGSQDAVLSVVRRQLTHLGFLPGQMIKPDNDITFFDPELEQALKAFQKAHSLNADGAYGMKTCKALNMTPQTRVQWLKKAQSQIKEQKEAWSNLSIVVNISTYTLFAINQGYIEQVQPVIIGHNTRRTPILKTPIVQLVLNPSWGVPLSILVKDKIKKIAADDTYLERLGFHVYDWDGIEVDPTGIDWADITEHNFPYVVRQQPGPTNALGNLKFVLQNDQEIYMHGTPDMGLFKKGERALSSGCIRVLSPLKLAEWVLDDEEYNAEKLKEMLDSEDTQNISIKPSIPVFTVDIPVFVDEKGRIVFGSDPYGSQV